MKLANLLFSLGIMFSFISCSSHVSLSALKDVCKQPGQVLDGEVEQTRRGYPYSFKIYLPPCYEDQLAVEYPVFYFIPGRGSAPSAWFSAGINEIADQLILDKALPPFIIVVTENTNKDSHGSDIYNDLLPYIENNYRVLDDRRYRTVAGGSLGGISSYRLGFQYPQTFSSVGMFGSGIISGEEEQVRAWLEAIPSNQKLRVFMDTGEADPLMLDRAKVMKSLLDKFLITNMLHIGKGGHDYNYWVSNLEMYFLWVAENWQ